VGDSLSDMPFRNLSPSRVVSLGLLVTMGLLLSGCAAEHIRNIEKAAKLLRPTSLLKSILNMSAGWIH